MITFEELKKKFEKMGYIASEELMYDAYNALCIFNDGEINPGQDIFAVCLEGPQGAGKTAFAETYTKICNELFDGNVEMVEYQCDVTTGKTELYEDINISAVIRGDADNVNIPGKLIEAIHKVNTGKKVVLFIDEYDKAKEGTDAFLLQFLQSGKINSTQHGDIKIKDEYKGNLQVIFCKNDFREELSGPLSRRLRIIRLDYMKPDTFYQVAHNILIEKREEKVNEALLNLVVLIYQHAYNERTFYNKLPSCPEMLIAIPDADRLLKRANAPKYVIYNTIIKTMFKSPDDIKTFEKSLEKNKDDKLLELINDMKNTDEEEKDQNNDLNSLLAETIFKKESEKYQSLVSEMEQLIACYKEKFEDMEKSQGEASQAEIEEVSVGKDKLVFTSKFPQANNNFDDEFSDIKRGVDIFTLSDNDWIDIAELQIPFLEHSYFIENLVGDTGMLGVKIYENGILLQGNDEQKIIIINEFDDKNRSKYRFMSNLPVIPSTYLKNIRTFMAYTSDIAEKQMILTDLGGTYSPKGTFSINSLVYNDSPLDFDLIQENVYNVAITSSTDDINLVEKLSDKFVCEDLGKVTEISKEIMSESTIGDKSGKKKVLKK